jgi:hypothetical protein
MGSVKPVSGEAAFPSSGSAAAMKGTASLPSEGKPPVIIPAGNDPVLSKFQSLFSPSFISASPAASSPGVNIQELYKQAAALLGLPQDTLGFALISAIRYFSLSPDAALLTRLRGDLLASGAASAPKTSREKAAMEAKALSVAAAADKGLCLSPEALEEYASAMDPGVWFSGGGERERQGPPEDGDPPDREETPEGEELEKLYAKTSRTGERGGKEELLSWLNRLPGKNGQGWIVFPFKIKVRGVELRVSVRLLIKECLFRVSGRDAGQDCLIVDIEGSAQNWRFILDRSSEGKSVMDITVYPGQAGDINVLKREAEKFFGGSNIRVRKSDESLSLIEQLHLKALPHINEVV